MSSIVDDRDPGISYNACHWSFEENPLESNGTSTFCNVAGGTVTYHFTGADSFQVWGTLQASRPSTRSTYSIDDGPRWLYDPGPPPPSTTFNAWFFDSGPLSPGPHTIVITTLDAGFYYLDFFRILTHDSGNSNSPSPEAPNQKTVTVEKQATINTQASTPASPQSLPSSFLAGANTLQESLTIKTILIPTSSNSSIPTGSSDGVPASTAAFSSVPSGMSTVFVSALQSGTGSVIPVTASENANTVATGSHHPSKGEIAGAVIGGLVFLGIALGAMFYLLKRKRQSSTILSSTGASSQQSEVSPFVMAQIDAPPPRYRRNSDSDLIAEETSLGAPRKRMAT